MIIRSNGGYEINPLYPSTNWYEDEPDNYVIDETTPQGKALTEKVQSLYPFYTLNIASGVVIDVTARDPLPGEIPEPEPPKKTEEQLLIEQLQQDNESLMLAVTDLYEQLLMLQGGGI